MFTLYSHSFWLKHSFQIDLGVSDNPSVPGWGWGEREAQKSGHLVVTSTPALVCADVWPPGALEASPPVHSGRKPPGQQVLM